MTVSEVQPPDLDGFVSRAGRQESAIVGDVHRHDRQLVAVDGQKKLEGVVVEHLHGAVQDCHWTEGRERRGEGGIKRVCFRTFVSMQVNTVPVVP